MKFIGLTSLLFVLPLYGAAAEEELFRLTLTKGDTLTVFRQESRGKPLVMEQGGRVLSERSLLPDDQAYLEGKIKGVPLVKENGCGRASARLSGTSVGAREVLTCLESRTDAGNALLELANLLASFL